MHIFMPDEVLEIIRRLEAAGFEAYAVGGCVRDSLLGREPDDWDITTSARPEQVKDVFTRTVDTGIQHGTVTVLLHGKGFEVTTYRIDGKYLDGRHPESVEFAGNLEEDLKRRDFTINAMAYHPDRGLVDLYGGRKDLENGLIRAVGDPEKRFGEDALRMLRAIRFSGQLGFKLEDATRDAIKDMAPNLKKVSAERIRVELEKLLVSPYPERLRDAYYLGLTAVFLPEFDTMMDTPQNTPHHMYSVGEHTLHALMNIRADRILRMVMLFHDVGKPACHTTDANGIDHFKGHPAAGARITDEIMRRLKFDNETRRRVTHFVYWHEDRPAYKEASVRRLLSRIGLDYFPEMFEVKRADMLAQSEYLRQQKMDRLDYYIKIYKKQQESHECVDLKHLAVTGKDLVEVGIPQGKRIGELLQAALEKVLEDPDKNRKDVLLPYIVQRYKDPDALQGAGQQ